MLKAIESLEAAVDLKGSYWT